MQVFSSRLLTWMFFGENTIGVQNMSDVLHLTSANLIPLTKGQLSLRQTVQMQIF